MKGILFWISTDREVGDIKAAELLRRVYATRIRHNQTFNILFASCTLFRSETNKLAQCVYMHSSEQKQLNFKYVCTWYTPRSRNHRTSNNYACTLFRAETTKLPITMRVHFSEHKQLNFQYPCTLLRAQTTELWKCVHTLRSRNRQTSNIHAHSSEQKQRDIHCACMHVHFYEHK